MFDFAWSHILLIAVVALLVIGPKDLPRVLRTVGVWVGRARTIARDFQGNLDQMIREAELEDVRKEVEKVTTIDVDHAIETTIDPGGELKQSLTEAASAETVPSPPATALPAADAPAPEEAPPATAATTEEAPAAAAATAEEAPPAAETVAPKDERSAAEPHAVKSGTHD
jgi:sec-independent protein translocase protein TatB